MTITGGSLFSGIGGFDIAMERSGIEVVWQAEIDKACQSVLGKHFNARIISDVRSVNRGNAEPVGIICGGFPCQDLSIAGKRAGLDGERSGLWYEFARIIEEFKPGWVVIENVPGLLSSNGGRDMETVIRSLVKFGYGVAWRVLDAQYFGLAQQRKRVFIVGSLGSGRAAEVLFEREGGPGDIAPSRKAGERVAGSLDRKSASSNRGSQANEASFIIPINMQIATRQNGKDGDRTGMGVGENGDPAYSLQEAHSHAVFFGGNNTSGPIEVATAVNASGSRRYDFESETFVAHNIQQNDGGNHKRQDRPNGGLYVSETETASTVGTTDLTVVAWNGVQVTSKQNRSNPTKEFTPTLDSMGLMHVGVRRLTPTECERLQGFPDGWTEGQSDSARYRQLGNAVAVPVVEWIIKRIVEADK